MDAFIIARKGVTLEDLGQAYGMTNDRKLGAALDRALRVIVQTQGPAGSWSYVAQRGDGDLSLCVMQAKALRSATDSGSTAARSSIWPSAQAAAPRTCASPKPRASTSAGTAAGSPLLPRAMATLRRSVSMPAWSGNPGRATR